MTDYFLSKNWITGTPPPGAIRANFCAHLTPEGIDAVERALHETELGQCVLWNGAMVDWTVRYCSDPNALLSKLKDFVSKHLPSDNTRPLHSGQVTEQSDENRRLFIVEAERHDGRCYPIVHIEVLLEGNVMLPPGDYGNRFRLLHRELQLEQPARDFFDSLATRLEREYPDRIGPSAATGATESPQIINNNYGPVLQAENITVGGDVVGGNKTTNITKV